MRLHWMKDRVESKTCDVCWEPSANNLADYPTKHHSPAHHQKVRPIHTHIDYQSPTTMQGCVNMLSGLNATRHPVHKAAKPAPASQTNSAREHNACAIKPLKSVRGSPTRLSHHRDHRDNTRRTTRLGKKPFPPEQIVPCVSAITRQAQSRTRNACVAMPAQACQSILHKHRGPDVSSSTIPFKHR